MCLLRYFPSTNLVDRADNCYTSLYFYFSSFSMFIRSRISKLVVICSCCSFLFFPPIYLFHPTLFYSSFYSLFCFLPDGKSSTVYMENSLRFEISLRSIWRIGETTYNDDLSPVVSLFTGIYYCWIIYIFFHSCSFNFTWISYSNVQKRKITFGEVKCSPKQNCFALEKFSQ